MSLISKLPGPLLVFLGAFCLSFGGLIVKSLKEQLYGKFFWRQLFFLLVIIFLLLPTKKNIC